MILAVDRNSMANGDVKKYLDELISGYVMDIVPPEKINQWKEEGFIKSQLDAEKLTQLAQTILTHVCSIRCMKRVNANGDGNDFKCRKLHSVKDNPTPTEDCYIPIHYDWHMNTKQLLEKIGLYNSQTEKFGHSWFEPTRHMTSVLPNAVCNMSPVDRKLFAVLQSMQNLQWLAHTNGVAKYVGKFVDTVSL